MGSIEEKGQTRARRRNVKRVILNTVATAGLLSLALFAPNVIRAMHKLGIPLGSQDATVIARARKRLVQQGLLVFEGNHLKLTSRGDRALRWANVERHLEKTKPPCWDQRWRVLIFDIPEYQRAQRGQLRKMLIRIGFICLQRSVWIYPYDCEDVITLVKADMKIGKRVLYMIVDELEYDKSAREAFGLK